MEEKKPPTPGTPRDVSAPMPDPMATLRRALTDGEPSYEKPPIDLSRGPRRSLALPPLDEPALLVAFFGDDDRPAGRAFFDALDAATQSIGNPPLTEWENISPEARRAYATAERELATTGDGRASELAARISAAVNATSFERRAGDMPDFVASELVVRVLAAVGDAVRKRDELRLGEKVDAELGERLGAELAKWRDEATALGTQIARLVGVAKARVEVSENDRPPFAPVDSDRPMEAEVAFVERVLAWLDVPGAPTSSAAAKVSSVATGGGEVPTMVIGPSDGAGGVDLPPGATPWGDMGPLGSRLFAPAAIRDVLSAAIAWAYTPSNAEPCDGSANVGPELVAAVRRAVESGILPTPLWTADGVVVDPDEEPEAPPAMRDPAGEAEDHDRALVSLAVLQDVVKAVLLAVRDDLDPDEEPDDLDAFNEAFAEILDTRGGELAEYIASLRDGLTHERAARSAVAGIAAVEEEARRHAKKHGIADRHPDAAADSYACSVIAALSAKVESWHRIANEATRDGGALRTAFASAFGRPVEGLDTVALVAQINEWATETARLRHELRELAELRNVRTDLERMRASYDLVRDSLVRTQVDLGAALGDLNTVGQVLGVELPAKLPAVLRRLEGLRSDAAATATAFERVARAVGVDLSCSDASEVERAIKWWTQDSRALTFVSGFREVAELFGIDLDNEQPAAVVSAVRVLWGSHVDGSEDGAVATLDVIRKALAKIEELHKGTEVLLKAAAPSEHLFGDAHRFRLLEEAVGMLGCGVSDALDLAWSDAAKPGES